MKFSRPGLRTTVAAGIVAAIGISGASPAHAVRAFYNGNWLFEQCNTTDYLRLLECRIYIAGVMDGTAWVAMFGGRKTDCPPVGVELRQLHEIVGRYLKAHVERRQEVAAELVFDAIGEAFHCGW